MNHERKYHFSNYFLIVFAKFTRYYLNTQNEYYCRTFRIDDSSKAYTSLILPIKFPSSKNTFIGNRKNMNK